MTEAYLTSSYYYYLLTRVMDMQAVLDALAALLPAVGWTANGSNHYTSPVDALGRSLHCEFTRVSASVLNLLVKDDRGATVGERRMNINATAWNNMQVFYGQYHLIVDAWGPNLTEWLSAGLLDLTPEAQNAHTRYTYMCGSRTNTGTYSGNVWHYASMLDNNTVNHTYRSDYRSNGNNAGYQTLGGQYRYFPVEMYVDTATVTKVFAGRRYQQILVGSELCHNQSLIRLPIDTGVLGSFRGVGGGSTQASLRLACRVA